MPEYLPTLKGEISLASALASDDDMFLELGFPDQQKHFLDGLFGKQGDIESLVSNHLGLIYPEKCDMANFEQWMLGYYNVCIPIVVDRGSRTPRKRLIMRIPLPYKLGESKCPGNADEKLRCEAATFIWIQDHCPEIPIPFLWAFGFQNGQSFTATRDFSSSIGSQEGVSGSPPPIMDYPIVSQYSRGSCTASLGVGYLLMDYVEESQGKHLSQFWTDKGHEKERRANFFKDLSSIMLTMAQHAFPRIGSLTIDSDGYLRLQNRPLTFRLQQMENKGIPTDIAREKTFGSAAEYLSSLLSVHGNRIQHQANAIRDKADGEKQLSTLDAVRVLLDRLTSRKENSENAFVFSLLDVHPNNVYVDDDWHITCLIDLEWTCVRPAEMLLPPVWLTGRRVDELPIGEHLDAYTLLLDDFLGAFEEQEDSRKFEGKPSRLTTKILRDTWDSGKFWLYHALDNPRVLCNLFSQHISSSSIGKFGPPEYSKEEAAIDSHKSTEEDAFVSTKLQDRELYEKRLRERFEM